MVHFVCFETLLKSAVQFNLLDIFENMQQIAKPFRQPEPTFQVLLLLK